MHPSASARVKIFISYADEDARDAKTLSSALCRAGMDAYTFREDEYPVGSDIRSRLQEKLAEAHFFVLLWSKHAKDSKWIRDEIAFVQNREKMVLPILMDNEQPLPESLSTTHAIRAFGDQLGWELQVVNHIRTYVIAIIDVMTRDLIERMQEQEALRTEDSGADRQQTSCEETNGTKRAPSPTKFERLAEMLPQEKINLGVLVSNVKKNSNSPKMKAAATIATLAAVAIGAIVGKKSSVK